MILGSEPEDTLATYLMESYFALPSPQWVMRYDSTRIGFQTFQGSLDDAHWYLRYDAKFELPITRNLWLRYRYKRLADYGVSIEAHRIEPKFRVGRDLSLGLRVMPSFTKGMSHLGFGLGWFRDPLNYLDAALVIEKLAHNEAMEGLKPGLGKEVYTRQPVRFEIEASKGLPSGRFKFGLGWLPGSEKELQDPTAPSTTRRNSFELWGRLDYSPLPSFWVGLDGSLFRSFEEERGPDRVALDRMREVRLIPVLLMPVSTHSWMDLQWVYTYKLRNLYTRVWDGPAVLLSHRISPGAILGLGYQRTLRRRWEDGRPIPDALAVQNRLSIHCELFPRARVSITVREGLDLDNLTGFKQALIRGRFDSALRALHERAYFGLLAQI